MPRQEDSTRCVTDITTKMSGSVKKWNFKAVSQLEDVFWYFPWVLLSNFPNYYFYSNWAPKKQKSMSQKKASLRVESMTFTFNATVAEQVTRDLYLLQRSDHIKQKSARKHLISIFSLPRWSKEYFCFHFLRFFPGWSEYRKSKYD